VEKRNHRLTCGTRPYGNSEKGGEGCSLLEAEGCRLEKMETLSRATPATRKPKSRTRKNVVWSQLKTEVRVKNSKKARALKRKRGEKLNAQ